ncbi:MAG: lactonase family protein [Acidobacteria bacterium]|nr:lactonase family protein [Acidobacteriota bacterium]
MQNRRDFLAGIASLTAAIASRSLAASAAQRDRAAADPTFMYVGSFTSQGRGDGEGLSVYRSDRASRNWTLVQLLKDVPDPSFLTIDRQGWFLYSAHGGGTQATAYQIDQATGRLTILNQQSTGGENGVHLAIDATGRFLVVANYASGSLAVLPIKEDGTLGPLSDLVTLSGTPGPHRTQQTSSHPHHSPFDRTGRYLVVPDKGFDKVFVFRLDTARGKLVPGDPPWVESRAGAAPRHVDFHPSQPYAYVINELDSTITSYHFDPDKGALKPLQIVTTLPSSYTGNNSGAEIVVASSGRFLYGSNRGHDSIAIFAINSSTGVLTSVGWESTHGRTPRFFCLDPSGTHLYAANQNTDTVVIFRVNQTTGRLDTTGQIVRVGNPSTIVFR